MVSAGWEDHFFTALGEDHPDFLYIREQCRKAGVEPKYQELPAEYTIKRLQIRQDTAASMFQPMAQHAIETYDGINLCPLPDPILCDSYIAVRKKKREKILPIVEDFRRNKMLEFK